MPTTLKTDNLERLIGKLENPSPFLKEVAALLKARTVDRIITTKTDPDGKAWVQWAVSTARARAKRGTASRGLLYDGGRLVQGITAKVQGNQAIVGVKDVPYAIFLQQGTNKMPARRFLGIGQQDQAEIRPILLKYLRGTS